MTVYLIHLDQPYKGKRHYVGTAIDPQARLSEHKATSWTPFDQPRTSEGKIRLGEKRGNGANFLAVLNHFDIGYSIVRLWDGDRDVERRIKAQKSAARMCPLCASNYGRNHERQMKI